MQREDILKRIAEINAELERRKKSDRLAQYNAGKKKHKKQMAFHKCKKRNRWVFGGNRSGKTECGAVECLWMLRGNHPYRQNREEVFGWVVSLSQQVQRDVAQAKILSYLPKSWIADITMLSGRKDSPDEEAEVVETLLYCFNSVEDELARYYIPLETEENLSSENGVYNFADFSLRPVKIISVKSGGKPVKYSQTALSLITDRTEITVEYGYAPLKKGLFDESEFPAVLASEKLVAAGAASEFCLIDGEAQLSKTWESVYRGEIETVQRTRLSGLHLPPRRWV